MRAIYLRFADQAQADTALADHLPLARDDVGVVMVPTGATVTVDGIEQPAMQQLPGWHINLVVEGDLPAVLAPYEVTPAAPVRRFAGF